ncbi:unnamed protein product [Adineta ricciae]|uniref:EGF-like domain-containing protein n=2 Tax=Adineta ricciae TaxID=249248 RepID=A0A814NF44_ADIRI|nr:unnamed protein product [Adineta ricciae]
MMLTHTEFRYLALILMIKASTELFYNQLKFSPCATWNPNATTFANSVILRAKPWILSVSTNNTLFVNLGNNNTVLTLFENGSVIAQNMSHGLNRSYGIFSTSNNEVYVDNGELNHQVNKWILNMTTRTIVMNVSDRCLSLFIDMNDTLYCSNVRLHQIVKVSLSDAPDNVSVAAGNGTSGSTATQLYTPGGIFVDENFNLYVADYGNDRIQLFQWNQRNGTTVAGDGAPGTITLSGPSDIILDGNQYMYITELYNARIIASSPYGFRCLVGCTGINGSAANQLFGPTSLAFDSYGNIFVADRDNGRIQKFLLSTKSCEVSYNQPQFCSSAQWRSDGVTFANKSTNDSLPLSVFVDTNNTIFLTTNIPNQVEIWLEGSTSPIENISFGSYIPRTVFAALNGDTYIVNDSYEVQKWSWNSANVAIAMNTNATCCSLFIDFNNTLYCSLTIYNIVVKKFLSDSANTFSLVAGNGSMGSGPNTLSGPMGIFVDILLNLFVADFSNNRIQHFRYGELNGTTLAGNGSSKTFSLFQPIAVLVDADDYLFILEYFHSRIVRVGPGPSDYQCVVACTQSSGSNADQLLLPYSFTFDNYGNIFVADYGNYRTKIFFFMKDSCDVSSVSQTTASLITSELTNYTQMWNSSSSFPIITSSCSSSAQIGSYCNQSNLPCDVLQPCQNNGSCIDNSTASNGYTCQCLPGFVQINCQYDSRLCRSDTCFNNGICNQTSNTTFSCLCSAGWEGHRCQTKINYCAIATCYNKGVCQALLLNYTCLCLGDSYSGRHCEITQNRISQLQTVSKSFAFAAIVAMITAALFVIILDVLKYGFGFDSADAERRSRKRKKPICIVRFIYVNPPVNETTV